MLPIFWYLLKVIICSGILFGYYWFFLRNKIFHQYNRFYLLTTIALSLIFPLLKINFWQPASQHNQAIRVLRAVSDGDEYMTNIVITAQKNNWSPGQLYSLVYLIGSAIFLLIMLRTIYLIFSLLKRYPVQQIEEVSFVSTNDASTPFSFLKYIFWNNSIDINTITGRQIFRHEVAHIQEKHTYDKLFVNIVLIFHWCNPFFWFYRKELNMIHEFIADKKAVEDSDTSTFAAMILQAAYPKHRFELTNNFFYSPIKRRLLMLTKIDNPKLSYVARIMVLPLAVLIFAAFTFKTKANSHLYNGKKITVVIDAGHGGHDAGAKSADGTLEKDLTLAIAKKVKEFNSNDAIEIILIRNDDAFMDAAQKVEFAKSKNADLVISFHVDYGPPASANTKSGLNIFTAKDEYPNAGTSKILASAIINEFKSNFGIPVMKQINQRQISTIILQENNCPAVLIEAGFINNAKDLAYLKTNESKEAIAKNVLAAIEKFVSSSNLHAASNSETSNRKEFLYNVKDTIPAEENIDLSKALIVINGKIIGKAKIDPGNLRAGTINVKWLNKIEAAKKYGKDGSDGACEITFSEDAKLSAADLLTAEDYLLKKKLQYLEQKMEKQKLLLTDQSMAELDYEQKLELLKKADSSYNKAIIEKKLAYLDLEKQKQLQIKLDKEKLDYTQNLALIKEANTDYEKALELQKELLAKQDNLVFTQVEQSPQFTGGADAWRKFLMANLKANTPVDEGWKKGKYTVMVKFIVHTDGTVSDVTTENFKGTKTAQHCIDVIKKAPNWQPAVQNGKKVNAYHKQPITFVIEE